VQTLHDESEETHGFNLGMGVFTFTPVLGGRRYQLKIQEPIGIENKPALPTVKDSGVVLSIPGGVYGDKERSRSPAEQHCRRSLYVGAYCRGRLVDQQPVDMADKTEASVELKAEPGSGGVLPLTVFEKTRTDGDRVNLVPVAERLVYRTPSEKLNVVLTPDVDKACAWRQGQCPRGDDRRAQ